MIEVLQTIYFHLLYNLKLPSLSICFIFSVSALELLLFFFTKSTRDYDEISGSGEFQEL